jgi:hypothetical protein
MMIMSIVTQDPIVEEVRRAREAQAAKHGFDLKAILADAKKRQRGSGFKVVSFAPKPPRVTDIRPVP